ncbi:enhancer of split m4 protein-like [Musca vetustissima]|uniref:enhancer of split m4 protein-like n=1 Tax=Musca vetustissima TaxID=27455 RepID=UPI002AB7C7C0|nr:enhancer of split m4 protein-like [Musca vetustissima]
MDITISQKKSSSSMKKLFKQIFKSKKSVAATDDSSFESLENSRNASLESSMESYENDINESYEKEEEFDYTTTVPVHFIRTEQGTYFWTSAADFVPAYMQDRWAQA